jgi:hypothetical protein
MAFVPVIIVILFAIAFPPILPKGRGRRNASKRRGGVMCGPGGVSTRGKKFRMTNK